MVEIKGDRLQAVTYQGIELFFVDYRNLQGNEYIQALDTNLENIVALANSRSPKSLLFLVDISDSVISKEVLTHMKGHSKSVSPHQKAIAILGITGVRKFMLDVVRSFAGINVKSFDDEKAAKDWLVEQVSLVESSAIVRLSQTY